MAEVSTEVKAEAINVVVRGQDGLEVHFKVKPNTKFSKIMDAYTSKKGVEPGTFKFVFDGERVSLGDSTPGSLGLEEGDVVDAMQDQQGGGLRVRGG